MLDFAFIPLFLHNFIKKFPEFLSGKHHAECVEQVRHSPEKVFARLIRPNVDQRSVQVKKNGFEMIH